MRLFGRKPLKVLMFWHLTNCAKRFHRGAGLAAGPGLGTPPENRLRHKVGSKGQAREVPVEVLTPRKRVAPSTLVISVERRCGRSVSVSIRGSTWGVLLALALIATAAWLLTQ